MKVLFKIKIFFKDYYCENGENVFFELFNKKRYLNSKSKDAQLNKNSKSYNESKKKIKHVLALQKINPKYFK